MRQFSVAAVVAGSMLLAGAAAADEVTLRGAGAFAQGTAFSRPWEAFVDYVNERGEGVLQINVIGGPEAVPPFEVGNAVQSGVVDVANVTGAFYTKLIPEADALKLSTALIVEPQDELGVAGEGLGCSNVVHAVLFPQTVVVTKGGQAAFGADASASENYDVFFHSRGYPQISQCPAAEPLEERPGL